MTLTCIIVDDEPLAVQLLTSYVEKTPDLELLASYTDSISALNAVKEQKPDLLFLDIQMPNMDVWNWPTVCPRRRVSCSPPPSRSMPSRATR